MLRPLRRRLYQLLEPTREGDRAARFLDFFLLLLIIANVVSVILETVEPIRDTAESFFHAFEVLSVAIFSVEYLFRLWVCIEEQRFSRPLLGRLRWALTPLALIDLVAILPFYLPVVHADLRSLRLFRLLRLLRLAKLGRYSIALQTLGRVLVNKRAELAASISVLVLLLLVASSLIYLAEHRAQPQHFSSIPASMWWAVTTLTTVGYGDVYPVTTLGKCLGGLVAVLGIGLFALPNGIIAVGFLEELQRKRTCPHCGKEL